MIVLVCPKCWNDWKVPNRKAGRRVRCPECGEPVRAPVAPPPRPYQVGDVIPAAPDKPGRGNSLRAWGQADVLQACLWGFVVVVLVISFIGAMSKRGPSPEPRYDDHPLTGHIDSQTESMKLTDQERLDMRRRFIRSVEALEEQRRVKGR